ncbi:hypothetical protein GDO78_020224 [Eleutherodactylus coqui]|uniref:Fibronectin type-III domain-containing protein n=1 Tax=Eleutherodactylus coqui TaxID=57060 RepID=A0A8J6BBQ9_ELECQ|nr:hypothetical protein GDO78_020224 [Eleutherodactylus coqui]
MEAILPGVLLFTLAAASTPTPTSGPVPVPFGLKTKSLNFNTTLYWDYSVTSVTPYFQVAYYKNGSWTVVKNCENISRNYCDLSEKIVDPYTYYHVGVKAFVGSQMSNYAKTEIYLINDGK